MCISAQDVQQGKDNEYPHDNIQEAPRQPVAGSDQSYARGITAPTVELGQFVKNMLHIIYSFW